MLSAATRTHTDVDVYTRTHSTWDQDTNPSTIGRKFERAAYEVYIRQQSSLSF
jgi:hypothetical protein